MAALAAPNLPAHAAHLCEINAHDDGAASRARLLARMPFATSYTGLSFSDALQRREALRASMSSEIALRNRSFHLLFGDKMRTVRAAPVLDACDVLLIDALHEEESNSASGGIVKKLIADLPNALQRVVSCSTAESR